MPVVLDAGGALKAGATLQPLVPGLGDGDALAVGDVQPLADVDIDDGVVGVGVALEVEALEPAGAAAVAVGDDPGLALGAIAVLPGALADGHWSLLFVSR